MSKSNPFGVLPFLVSFPEDHHHDHDEEVWEEEEEEEEEEPEPQPRQQVGAETVVTADQLRLIDRERFALFLLGTHQELSPLAALAGKMDILAAIQSFSRTLSLQETFAKRFENKWKCEFCFSYNSVENQDQCASCEFPAYLGRRAGRRN